VHCGVKDDGDAELLEDLGASQHRFDADDANGIVEAATAAMRRSGSIEGLITLPERGLFGSVEESDVVRTERLFRRNLSMVTLLVQSFMPIMRSNRRGSVVIARWEFFSPARRLNGWMRACDAAMTELVKTLAEEVQGSGVVCYETKLRLESENSGEARQVLDDTAGHSAFYQGQIEERRRIISDSECATFSSAQHARDICDMLPARTTPTGDAVGTPDESSVVNGIANLLSGIRG